jgi:alkanesulfonate monooxygenase SsuD/methylene tetrahydromethanopterin reductase-like flavin-dependent oxidoreductase (luciferase family)
MVFVVPLYHPLRLIAEICMLDQISGGRLELSFGRGASPIEVEYFGINADSRQDIYAEAVEVILRGLTNKTLDFHGKHFDFDSVPMELAPLQKPHPPVWYGVHAPDSAERAAKRNLNVVSLDSPAETRLSIDRYRATWRPPHPGAQMPKLGLGRFIVVAETDAKALHLARRAYVPWHQSFTFLPRLLGRQQTHPRPADWDTMAVGGQGIAGSPKTVIAFLQQQLAETQCNYVVGQFAFGDMTLNESLNSIGLFASEVMPALRATAPAEKMLIAANNYDS